MDNMEVKEIINVAREFLLIVGIICIAYYSIQISNNSLKAVEDMNSRIQMMFVKS